MENNVNIKSVVLDEIKSFCVSRGLFKAVYLNIHNLDEKLRTSVHKNELTNMFMPLVREGYAKSFLLQNDDFVVVYNRIKDDDILSLMVKVQFLFQEDERIKETGDLQKSGVVVSYDLSEDYGIFLKKIEAAFIEEKKENNQQTSENVFYQDNLRVNKKNLTTEMLSKVQKIISISDFSSFIRRQPICAIIGKSAPQRVYEEVFVSVEDMRDSLLPGVDVKSNPWLHLALLETLNKRVLEVISRHDDGDLSGNFSININVSSILSDEFIQFDDSINASMRQTVVLELQLEDIFSDMNSYILAKTFAKVRGYRICIDGINVDKLKYVNRKQLDCDLMKIEWHPSLIDIFTKDEHFMDYMNKAERAKIILCNVDDALAVEAGNNLGINLYQGRYVQKLMSDSK